jgi:glycosyltransferase involved in cell wall biosynthesis
VNRPPIVFGMNTMFAVRQFLPEVLEMVRDRGFRVVVLAPPEEMPLESAGAVEYRAVKLEREIAPLSDMAALFRIWAVLAALRPAITNMSTPKMGLVGGLAAVLARVPNRIYTLRGLRYETTVRWKRQLLMLCERIACRCAHRVLCVSRSVREAIVRDGICPPAKAALLGERVSEGIRIPPQSGAARRGITRPSLGIPADAAVLGFVGRLTNDKGVPSLVQACRLLRSRGFPVHLLLAGGFESGDPVDAATAAWIRTDTSCHWMGSVPDATPYYELMDVFVFPTRREGLGKVLLEAAVAGKPVVSTRTTGVVDVVQDGVTGLLVPPDDPESLARAVAALISDRVLAARMGESARMLVREHFDNSIYLQRLGTMLESLAAGPAAQKESRLRAEAGT